MVKYNIQYTNNLHTLYNKFDRKNNNFEKHKYIE